MAESNAIQPLDEPAADDTTWFVRRGAQVRGPYAWSTIEMNLALGRIRGNDEVCPAGPGWRSVAALRPEPALPAAPASAPDAARRRAPSPLAARRQRAARVWESLREAPPAPRRGRFALTLAAFVVGLLALAVLLASPAPKTPIDCDAAPAAGVNWDFCMLAGLSADGAELTGISARNARLNRASLVEARLAESDLAYADLSGANLALGDLSGSRLVGSSLRDAILHHTDLRGADLRFADLSGASLVDVALDGARLDNAIWPDGRTCAPDSRGACGQR